MQQTDGPGEELTAFFPKQSALTWPGAGAYERAGLEQLDANSSLKLLVSKCPRERHGFEESSSQASRAPATFLIKPRTRLQGVFVYFSSSFPGGDGKSWSQRQCKGLASGFSVKTQKWQEREKATARGESTRSLLFPRNTQNPVQCCVAETVSVKSQQQQLSPPHNQTRCFL